MPFGRKSWAPVIAWPAVLSGSGGAVAKGGLRVFEENEWDIRARKLEEDYRWLQKKVLHDYFWSRTMIFVLAFVVGTIAFCIGLAAEEKLGLEIAFGVFCLWGLSEWRMACNARRNAEDLAFHPILNEDHEDIFQMWMDLAGWLRARALTLAWCLPCFLSFGLYFRALALCGDDTLLSPLSLTLILSAVSLASVLYALGSFYIYGQRCFKRFYLRFLTLRRQTGNEESDGERDGEEGGY
jgi:hypothetical protein